MNKLFTACLLVLAGAGLNLFACRSGCGSCAEKPVCEKQVTVTKRACPEAHTVYSCPDGYHEAGKEEANSGNKKQAKGKSQNY